MAFPRAKRLTRLRQIAQVMIKHGLGFLLVQAGLGHLVPRLARRPTNRGVELRGALEELGPTFVKLGQALSTRRDLLPPDVVKELEGLQDRAPSFPLSQVKEVIAAELGHPLDELFSYFSPEPLAAASIGQVHLARLPDGREVAVKVQRPGIVDQVEVDLAILAEVAALVESRTSWGRAYGLRELVQEFARTIRAELDYVTEAEHCRRFARNCTGDPEVRIPQVLTDLSAHRVLTLEYEAGIKVTDVAALVQAGYDPSEIARRLVRAVMRQVFEYRLFHADPHPGNISVLPGPVIFLMDFGQVGQLTPLQGDLLQEGIVALARQDVDTMVQVALDLGAAGDLDQQEFTAAVGYLLEKYYAQPMGGIDPVQAVRDALDLARRFRVKIPSAFALLGKTLATLEAVVTTLDPDLSLVDLARPIAREVMHKRLQPWRLWRRASRDLQTWWAMFRRLPRRLERVIAKLDRDTLRIRFTLADQELLFRLEQVATRLAMAILFLGLAVLLTGLIVAGAVTGRLALPGWILGMPFLAAGGGVLALMALGLLIASLLSGRHPPH